MKNDKSIIRNLLMMEEKTKNKLSQKSRRFSECKKYYLPFIIFVIIVTQSVNGLAQSDNWPLGTRAASMGNAYVAESDIWSVHHNQAGLGFFPHLAIGFHHENKFIVDEYSLHALALTIPAKPGTFGISYSYFGYSNYNESKLGLGFGRQFGNGFAAGIQMNYHYNYIFGDYGNRHALSVEGGIQYKASEQVTLGAHIFNPTKATIAAYDLDTIPTYFNMGISYTPLDNFRLNLQLNKRLDYQYRILGGIEFMMMENLYFRGGIMTNPFKGTFGLGYKLGLLSADIGFTYHDILGFTPHFSFQTKLKKNSLQE